MEFKNRKILITGGAGYIGSVIAEKLLERGDQVVIYDNLSTGFRDSLPQAAKFVLGDVRDSVFLARVLKDQKIDAVIHMAAKLLVAESVEKPLDYYENNVGGTIGLLRACQMQNISSLVFSSTAATYGNPVRCPIDETDPQQPVSPYGESKLMAEKIIRDSAPKQNLNYCILRYFNVAGAMINQKQGQRSQEATHLVKVASQVAAGIRKELMIFGQDYATADGTCVRDYIHVEDLALAHLSAVDYLLEGGASDIFNCGYGQGLSVLEVLQAFKRVLGEPLNQKVGPRRPGDPEAIFAATQKIQKLLGWKPQFNNIELIVKTAFEWEKSLLHKMK